MCRNGWVSRVCKCKSTAVLSDLTVHATIQTLHEPYSADPALFQDALGVSYAELHVYAQLLSCVCFETLWTVACQPPLSVGFSRQEHWSGLPCPSPEDLPGPGIDPTSSASAGSFFTTEPPGKPYAEVPFHQIPQTQHRQQQLKSIEFKCQLLIKSIFCRHSEDVNGSSGQGNGNPLQCSCLENPRDGGAWWAAVYGASQSRTRLKRLSSSSSSSSNGSSM